MMAYHQRVNQFKSRIDFDDPTTTKPPSLAKSAVLQALEEEERQQQSRGKGLKRVAWPPSAEGGDEYEQVQQQQPQPQQHQQQQQYYQQPQAQHQPAPTYQQYQQPAHQQQQPRERIIPIQRPDQQQQSPASPQLPQYQPQPTQAFQPLVSQQQQQFYQPEQQQQQLHQHQQPEAVPFFTTLRSEPPMSQEPAPVYQAEPAAAIYQGGSNMRGDQKWPPEEVKKQSELENEERRRLAQEPAFRPRKVAKDYSNFFAKNALNQTYPGYRAPPGTQHHS